jgi:hypothetical protein
MCDLNDGGTRAESLSILSLLSCWRKPLRLEKSAASIALKYVRRQQGRHHAIGTRPPKDAGNISAKPFRGRSERIWTVKVGHSRNTASVLNPCSYKYCRVLEYPPTRETLQGHACWTDSSSPQSSADFGLNYQRPLFPSRLLIQIATTMEW